MGEVRRDIIDIGFDFHQGENCLLNDKVVCCEGDCLVCNAIKAVARLTRTRKEGWLRSKQHNQSPDRVGGLHERQANARRD